MRHPIRLYLAVILSATATLELSAQTRNRIDRANFDTTCAPCGDFYQYANGAWIAHTAIPVTEPTWSAADEVARRVDSTLRVIVRQASRDRSAREGDPTQLIGAFYRSCMDLTRIEARGVAPLRPLLAPIESIRRADDVSLAISRLQAEDIAVAFDFVSRVDELDATKVIAVVTQGGLGLPTRDEYFGDDARSRALREAYQQYLVELFTHAGDSPAQARDEAARDMKLEVSLASASSSPAQLRAGGKYRRMLFGQLQELTPHFQWREHPAPRHHVRRLLQSPALAQRDRLYRASGHARWSRRRHLDRARSEARSGARPSSHAVEGAAGENGFTESRRSHDHHSVHTKPSTRIACAKSRSR